ncbi:MAG: hypothetical protein WDM91_04455 [Rhizomicrobium sp.]
MTPLYWIVGLIAIVVLFWQAKKGNGTHARRQKHADSAATLERENLRLRHVLAELTVENHALKYRPPDYW